MSLDRLYADYAATAPLKPAVREAMAPWLGGRFGNASSMHAEGRTARAAIDRARELVSEAVGCLFGEVLFTSSGTEAANTAILGAALASLAGGMGRRRRILVGAAEHHCVLGAAESAAIMGFEVLQIPVTRQGRVELDLLARLLSEDVLLVSVMHANNELGTVNPVREIADRAHAAGALFHTDAVQTLGKLPVSMESLGADMISLSAHKIGGPQGIGALVLRSGTKIKPLMVGGGQEREMRAGTESVAAIVGFGEACRALPSNPEFPATEAFWAGLTSSPVSWARTVEGGLPSHAHMRFPGLTAESMLIALDRMGVSASSGAACSSGALEPSHVLLACGYSPDEANEGLRFTFGNDQSAEIGAAVADRVIAASKQVRGY